ncbi:MAG: choice-of-anchor Q domain-containing protein, partial [Chloroflexota bacterium]
GDGGTWQWMNSTYTTFAAYQSGSGNDMNGINQIDPLFVNADTGDLHLQLNSAVINAGLTLAQSGSLDIDGEPRVTGSEIDLGADESQ